MSNKYFGSVIDSFSTGIQLDCRVKLAADFIRNTPDLLTFANSVTLPGDPPFADKVAILALEIASALVDQADQRGWTAPMLEDGGINSPMKKHIERQVRQQVYAQGIAPRIQAEESTRVQPVAPLVAIPPNHGRSN